MFYVYFLKSQKNSKIHVGSTQKDPKARLKEHNEGSNQWSRLNRPFILIYFEEYECKKDALKREKFYKSGFGRRIRDAIIRSVSSVPTRGGSASGGG